MYIRVLAFLTPCFKPLHSLKGTLLSPRSCHVFHAMKREIVDFSHSSSSVVVRFVDCGPPSSPISCYLAYFLVFLAAYFLLNSSHVFVPWLSSWDFSSLYFSFYYILHESIVSGGVANPSGWSFLYCVPQGPFFVYSSVYFFIPYSIRPFE
jgi:hypothetical protein